MATSMAGDGTRKKRFIVRDLQKSFAYPGEPTRRHPRGLRSEKLLPVAIDYARAKLWAQKWRWYERNALPWNRARIHWELMRREAFARWPLHGNVLEALRDGRLELGPHVLLEPDVWISAPGDARIRIGAGTFLNIGVMVAAQELVEIGEHC